MRTFLKRMSDLFWTLCTATSSTLSDGATVLIRKRISIRRCSVLIDCATAGTS